MDQSMKIQMDIKNNAQDLQNYVLDLNNWEKEMKKKELELSKGDSTDRNIPPPRNKIKRNQSETEKENVKTKSKKISGYDYSAWDKYDVDKACAELDNEEEISLSKKEIEEMANSIKPIGKAEEGSSDDSDNEDNLSLIDQALYEKELGNQFVKKGEWKNAIKCYTKAISLDSKNPIYYANRSLCFLKLKEFRSSEVDATTAIQLDKSYVKAYQRRGYARLALGQLAEAKVDFEEVLKLEPKNSLMSLEINKINEKLKKEMTSIQSKATFNHKNLFKKEESDGKVIPKEPISNEKSHKSGVSEVKKTNIDKKSVKINVEKGKEEVINAHEISNSTKNKGDGDLKTEKCDEVKVSRDSIFGKLPEHCRIVHPIHIPPHKRSKKPLVKIPVLLKNDMKRLPGSGDASENAQTEGNKVKESKTTDAINSDCLVNKYEEDEKYNLDVPKTSVQFQNNWKIIKKYPEDAYKYLKKISDKLPEIFVNSLESDLFSDLLNFLAGDVPGKELPVVYSFLLNLSKVKRFSSMTLFMTKEDKESVKKCASDLKGIQSENEISMLLQLYEL